MSGNETRMKAIVAWLERHGFLFAVACIAVSTPIFYLGRDHFPRGQWALLYLPVIVLVASSGGVRPALLAAVLAFFAGNFFFLVPYHTLFVTDPKDWLSLFVFLLVGIAMGLQTGRMRARESQALDREREAVLLNRFSSHLVSETTVEGTVGLLPAEIAKVTGALSVLYLPDDSGVLTCFRASEEIGEDRRLSIDPLASWVYAKARAIGLPSVRDVRRMGIESWPLSVLHDQAPVQCSPHDIYLPLQSSTRIEGVLHVGARTDGLPHPISDVRLIVSIANQAAAFLERRHLQHAANQANALREADHLKSAFISSVSHELKTPLASVTATVTGLLEGDLEWDAENVRTELRSVDDDLNRLNDSIGSLLDLSRLEANSWLPQKDWYEFGEILGTALSRIPERQKGRVKLSVPDGLPSIQVDFAQWARVLRNLLENALAYSGPGRTPVCVGAASVGNQLRMWVEDAGPGISREEKSRIFEKFYRGEAASIAPSGTGLGLSITREIVRFHGGQIFVEDVEPHGARFVVTLPIAISEGEAE